MWQVLHAMEKYFSIIPPSFIQSLQSYCSLSRIYCCPKKTFKVEWNVTIQQFTDPLSSSTSSSLLGTDWTASELLWKHLTRNLQAQIKDHLVLTPRLLRIIMQSERSNTPPTDQKVKLQVRFHYFYFLPNPTETQIHSVFKLMSLQPSTATCLAPNSFLSSFEWSFSCSLKHFFVDHSFLCSVSTWDILEMFGLECPGSK